jgi:hypothetical protein
MARWVSQSRLSACAPVYLRDQARDHIPRPLQRRVAIIACTPQQSDIERTRLDRQRAHALSECFGVEARGCDRHVDQAGRVAAHVSAASGDALTPRGAMHKAASAWLACGFERSGLKRVIAVTKVHNAPLGQVLQAVSMCFVRRTRMIRVLHAAQRPHSTPRANTDVALLCWATLLSTRISVPMIEHERALCAIDCAQ